MRLTPLGPEAVLVEDVTGVAATAAARHLLSLRDPRVLDAVPAADTLLVRLRAPVPVSDVERMLTRAPWVAAESAGRMVTIPVRYDGADLAAVADSCGLGVDDVVRLHAGTSYAAAFAGFTPGFVYLTGLPETLRLGRRATPRRSVPAGSVAIADRWCGVYPAASPGGWHLLGTTDVRLWSLADDPPALVQPGDVVRFESR